MGAISGQWSLNEAMSSVSDILRASTSDNIQFNALLVVQAFGVQLAVSETTRLKIETLSRAPHLHYTVQFLKSRIGYAKGDSADYLARSDGGIRFLSLASALLCTSDTFFAASTLHGMILETAPASYKDDINGPGLPTVKMLQQLLEALDHRLCRVGFAKYIAGFQISLGQFCPLGDDDHHPSMDLIKALVNAFRSTHRLGSDGMVEIRAYVGLPWIVAFTKWTLDDPPTIVSNDGKILLESPSRVIVSINKNASEPEEVKLMHKIRSPDVLWSGPLQDNLAWSGMMSVQTYGQVRLAAFGLNSSNARQAVREAMMFTIPLVVRRLWPGSSDRGPVFHPALGPEYHNRKAQFLFPQFRTHLFGNHQQLKSILEHYLDLGEVRLSPSFNEHELRRVPALELHLDGITSDCGCRTCTHEPLDYDEDSRLGLTCHSAGAETNITSLATSVCGNSVEMCSIHHRCAGMRFWAHIAIITAEILALSLYDCTQDIQVHWPGASRALERVKCPFLNAVYRCIFVNSRSGFCRTRDVLGLTLSLAGHRVDRQLESGTWIASAFRGQVVYPILFDLGGTSSNPLVLGGGPGQLLFQDSKPEVVVSSNSRSDKLTVEPRDTSAVPELTCILTLFPQDTLKWHISLTAEDPELYFGTPRCQIVYNPHDVIATLSRSLYVSCEHPEDTPLSTPVKDCVFTTAPLFESTKNPHDFNSIDDFKTHVQIREVQNESGRKPFKIQVLPTAGNEGLRLFAMCSPWPGVVRDKACLQCCIEVCRKSGLEYIVL